MGGWVICWMVIWDAWPGGWGSRAVESYVRDAAIGSAAAIARMATVSANLRDLACAQVVPAGEVCQQEARATDHIIQEVTVSVRSSLRE